MLRKVILGAVLLLVVAIAALFVAIRMIPPGVLENQFEQAASDALGRDVTISEPPGISVFPTQLKVSGLEVANAEGFEAPYFAKVEEARIGVKLFALLSRKVEITEFVMASPDIRLEAAKDGRVNWAFGAPPTPPAEQDTQTSSAQLPKDVRLGDVRIDNGQITFVGSDGVVHQLEAANLTVGLPSLASVLTMKGDFLLEGRASEIDLKMETPRSLMSGEPATVSLRAKIGQNSVSSDLTLRSDLSFDGEMEVDFQDLRDLADLSGTPIETENGFKSFSIKGPVRGSSSQFAFGDATSFAFDDISGDGSLSIDLADNGVMLSGDVELGVLDLTPYIPVAADTAETTPAAGFPEWSEAKIDLSALAAVNADLKLGVDALIVPPLEIGASQLEVKMQNGDVSATIPQMALYSGSGNGVFSINVARAEPQLTADFSLQNVEISAFTQDLINMSRLNGKSGIEISLKAQGSSQADWVRSLNGTASADLSDGAIEGVNLGKIVRGATELVDGLQSGGLNPAALGETFSSITATANAPAESTDFSSLVWSTQITRGIASTRSLKMYSPVFETTGTGTIDLPAQTVNLSLSPTFTEHGRSHQLPAPIFVRGSFSAPELGLDTQNLVQNLARDGIAGLLRDGGLSLDALSSDDAGAANDSLEDELLNEGLNALFGKRRGDD